MSKKNYLFLVGFAVLLAVLYDFLFPIITRGPRVGLNFSIFMFVFIGLGLLARIVIAKKPIASWTWWLLIPLLWFVSIPAIYENETAVAFSVLSALATLIFFWFWQGESELSFKKIKKIIPISGLAFIGAFFVNVYHAWTGALINSNKKLGKIIIAIIVAIPIVLIFTALFVGADMIFSQWVRGVFNFQFDAKTIWRIFRTVIFICLFSGVIYSIAKAKRLLSFDKKVYEKDEVEHAQKERTISNTIMVILNALFAIFLVSQIRFFIGGYMSVKDRGFTYSQYATQGFYQLIFAALLVFVISYVMIRINRTKKFNLLNGLIVAFIVQTFVIAISAIKRVYLYIDAYGLTDDRFLAKHFAFYLMFLLVALGITLVMRKHYNVFVKTALIFSFAYMMFITGINIDARIAKYNIDKYYEEPTISVNVISDGYEAKEQTRPNLDYKFLIRTMSVDALSQMERLENDENEIIRGSARYWLGLIDEKPQGSEYYYYYRNKRVLDNNNWQAYTLSRLQYQMNMVR